MVEDGGSASEVGGGDRGGFGVEPRLVRGGARPGRRRRGGLITGLVVALAIAAISVAAALAGGPSTGTGVRVVSRNAKGSVLAALSATVGTGSYDMTFTLQVTPGTGGVGSQPCPTAPPPSSGGGVSVGGPVGRCVVGGLASEVDVSGHGTVNVDPYAMVAISTVTGLGPVTVSVNGTTVWEEGGGYYGSSPPVSGAAASGASLSGFAGLVEGTLGRGQGALTMISLASHNRYLNLEQEAVVDAKVAGTGTVDGTNVTYYDVTVDVAKLANAANLTDEERTTIQDASKVLADSGYSGTDEKIGVDPAGLIREVNATARFSDGSVMTRHTIFSDYGCAATVYMPNEQAPVTTTTVPCTTPDATTTSTPPSTATPSAATTSAPAPTTAPDTATSSDEPAIRAAFLGWINAQPKDGVNEYVEDFGSIADSLRQGIAQHSAEDLAKYSGLVDSVRIIDATHADVRYTILFDGYPQYAQQPGQAIKIDGIWKVTRDTVCNLLTYGGITCPPRT
jgi:hypothetical protein